MNYPNIRELRKIGKWIKDGETGLSSLAICSFYLIVGNGGTPTGEFRTPSDPSDFGRCIGFLEECIDESNQYKIIFEMGSKIEAWKRIKYEWFVLLKLYDEEKNQKTAPKLYEFMKKCGL